MKSFSYNSGQKPSKRLLLPVGILGVFVLLGASAFALDAKNIVDIPLFPDKPAPVAANEEDKVNYDPPTEEEKKETEAFKDQQATKDSNSATTPTPTPGNKKAVTPIISSWPSLVGTQDLQIGGFINGVIEDGGTCTAKLTLGSTTVTATSTGIANAQNVACGSLVIQRAKLQPGTWKLVLVYESATSQGTSAQDVTIEVQ